jgi:hypothetical protein
MLSFLASLKGQRAWDLSAFETCDTAQFNALVAPFASAMRLTYTSTAGSSYWKPADANATVDGFSRSSHKHDPVEGGMRALAFVDRAGSRLLLAFRGTDLDSSGASGQADACADDILFRGMRRDDLPPFCSAFSDATLDYLGNAVEFAAEASHAYPSLDTLATGHSLGAALAVLVAARLNPQRSAKRPIQVVAISEPPIARALDARLRAAALPPGTAYVLADANDPVQRAAVAAGLVGTPCTWSVGPPPHSCTDCDFASGHSATCKECILATHALKHYLALLRGPRPICAPPSGLGLVWMSGWLLWRLRQMGAQLERAFRVAAPRLAAADGGLPATFAVALIVAVVATAVLARRAHPDPNLPWLRPRAVSARARPGESAPSVPDRDAAAAPAVSPH